MLVHGPLMALFQMCIWMHVGVALKNMVRTWKVRTSPPPFCKPEVSTNNSLPSLCWKVLLTPSRGILLELCWSAFVSPPHFRLLIKISPFSILFLNSLTLKSQGQCPKFNRQWEDVMILKERVSCSKAWRPAQTEVPYLGFLCWVRI